MNRWTTLTLAAALLLAGCQSPGKADHAAPASDDFKPLTAQDDADAIDFNKLIRPQDHILFLGDELTQQMYFTRMVAAAVLPMRAKDNLRFYNGGYEGATAASGLQRFEKAVELSSPTVVFVCLGANDAPRIVSGELDRRTYRDNLTALVQQLKSTAGVREIVLLSAPALQQAIGVADGADTPLGLEPGSENAVLYDLSLDAETVARQTKVNFVDIFEHTLAVYRAQDAVGGEPLTVNGRMPTDVGHVVIASIVLRGIGVDEGQLEKAAWSPLTPRKMGRVRQALAVRMSMPSMQDAEKSRAVFMALQQFDEAFFRAWRIAGRSPSTPSVEAAISASEHAWDGVRTSVRAYSRP
jgi:lysophospholipase L1-like esterase